MTGPKPPSPGIDDLSITGRDAYGRRHTIDANGQCVRDCSACAARIAEIELEEDDRDDGRDGYDTDLEADLDCSPRGACGWRGEL